MARTPGSGRVKLCVKVQFEANRLSDQCLATAYELVLPLVAYNINEKKKRPRIHEGEDMDTRLAVKNG